MNQKTLKLILSEMKNLLILILAIDCILREFEEEQRVREQKNEHRCSGGYFPLTILQLGFQDLSRENG